MLMTGKRNILKEQLRSLHPAHLLSMTEMYFWLFKYFQMFWKHSWQRGAIFHQMCLVFRWNSEDSFSAMKHWAPHSAIQPICKDLQWSLERTSASGKNLLLLPYWEQEAFSSHQASAFHLQAQSTNFWFGGIDLISCEPVSKPPNDFLQKASGQV